MTGVRVGERKKEMEEGRRKLRWYRLEWKNETMEVKYKWEGEEGRGKRKGRVRETYRRDFFLMKFSSVNSLSLWFSFGRVLHFFFFCWISSVKCFFPPPLFFLFCAIPVIFLETIGSFCQDRLFRFRNIVRSGRRDGFEAHRSVKIREQNVYRWRVLR